MTLALLAVQKLFFLHVRFSVYVLNLPAYKAR